jgi:hypothetical protein
MRRNALFHFRFAAEPFFSAPQKSRRQAERCSFVKAEESDHGRMTTSYNLTLRVTTLSV